MEEQSSPDQVVYLEVSDDVPVIREILSWTEARRVILVVHPHSQLLRNKVNLRLVQRYGADLGKDLALVTSDRTVRELAYEVGLPIFHTVERATDGRWSGKQPSRGLPPPGPKAEKPRARSRSAWQMRTESPHVAQKVIAVVLFAAILLVLIGGGLLVVPGADVTMVPVTEPIERMVEIRADPAVAQVDFESKLIPARLLGIEVEGTTQVPTSAKRDSPDSRATGKVVFVNQLSQPVTVGVGSVVATSAGTPIRFTTVEQVTLEPRVGATSEASVIAMDPGPSGNVRPFLINTVEGPQATRVKVINDQPMAGGGVRQVGVVTQADKDQARTILLQQLQQKAVAQLQVELGEQEYIPPESVRVFPLDETYDRFVGEQADALGLKMRVAARGTVLAGNNANALILNQLEKSIDPKYQLLPQGLMFQPGEVLSVGEDGTLVFKMRAVGNIGYRVLKNEVIEAIQGRPIEAAFDYLARNYVLQKPPEIRVVPDWLGIVPLFPFRIQVQVKPGTA